jgi:hypothetical protein
MTQQYHVQTDVSRFIEKGCISTMDNLITWNFENEFDFGAPNYAFILVNQCTFHCKSNSPWY